MEKDIYTVFEEYDKAFWQNHWKGDLQSKEAFEFCDKASSLILSAPHATRSVSAGKERVSDKFTGALVRYLGEENGLSTLIRVKCSEKEDCISEYVAQHILQNHYFLDIHGFDKDIGFDMCLGIGKGFCKEKVPFLENILEIAEKHGIKTAVNHPKYSGSRGFTGQYQSLFHAPNVIQVELSRPLRDFYNHLQTVQNVTIPFFKETVMCYKTRACLVNGRFFQKISGNTRSFF